MGIDPDPYRTLGLNAGASADEIRRAYRRLAKANHPDSAGEAALPRFLAIQAAYEALAAPTRSRRPGGRPSARPAPSTESWRADPDRARQTREGAGRRWNRPGTAGPDGSAGADGVGTRRRRSSDGTQSSGPDQGRRPSGRKRPPNKATLGSTSYDAAEDEPFEPEWTGGTWYGASSGTYWTLNPKEYADPRKHGPEYQARARRRADAGEADPLGEHGATGPEPGVADWAGEAADPSMSFAGPPPHPPPEDPARPEPSDPISAATEAAARGLTTPPRTFVSRLALALIGWAPLGVAFASIAGEATGCGRFAASCIELFGVGTWLVQLAIIVGLLALPGVAAISATGTLAALAASIPTAVVLSASGGANEPVVSASMLGVVMAIAYVAGVVFALTRRRRSALLR